VRTGARRDRTGQAELDATTLFIVGLFLLVGSAVLVGELFTRLGQAALVGQLLVGVILGPSLLGDPLGLTSLSTEFQSLQFLATFFILMMAGLSVTPQQIRATGLPAAALGVAIFVVPFVLGAGLVRWLYPGMSTIEALFVSLTISITALPVLGVMLREFGLMESRFGTLLMNTSLVNELAAVTTFAVLLRVNSEPNGAGIAIATSVLTVGVFLASVLAAHYLMRSLRQYRLWDRIVERFRERWRTREAGFAVLLVFGLGAALYSQLLGLTFLVGAFYAGLLITPESAGRREHRTINFIFEAVTWGFFIPLFFALVGFGMNFRLLGSSALPILAFAVLVVFALFSKLFIGTAVTRSLGWSYDESFCAGFLVSSRGAVELAMAVILLGSGIFSVQIYTVVAGVGLLTTAFAPIGARPFVRSIGAERRAVDERSPAVPLEPSFPPRRLYADDERVPPT
jgi:Kef-type K+ transport system membrane component KefB